MQSSTSRNHHKTQYTNGSIVVGSSSSSSTSKVTQSTASTSSQSPIPSSSLSLVLKSSDFTLIKSSVTKYQSSNVDLNQSRNIHCLNRWPCLTSPIDIQTPCRTVHHGQCVPVKVPEVSSPLERVTSPDYAALSPLSTELEVFSFGGSSSASSFIYDDDDEDQTVIVPPEIPPRTCSHFLQQSILNQSSQQPNKKVQQTNTSHLDPSVTIKQLLSSDTILEDQLEQLLKEFVKEEKMRQESKKMSGSKQSNMPSSTSPSSLADRRSLSMSSLNAPSNYGPSDYYIRGRSSHNSSQKVVDPRPNFLYNFFHRSFSIPSSINPSPKKLVQKVQGQNPSQGKGPDATIDKSPSVTRKALSTSHKLEVNDPTPSSHHLKSGPKPSDPMGKMGIGLSDKTSKGKYIEISNNRGGKNSNQQQPVQAPSKKLSRSTEQLNTLTDQQSPSSSADSPKVVKKKVKRSNSMEDGNKKSPKMINVMNNPFEQVLNEVLQLTDDEKACILASHQQSLNQKLKQQRKQDFVQQQQLVLESKQQKVQTNLNKKKSFSSDSISNKKLLADFDSMLNNPTAINYSNPIDYARTRFINSVNTSKSPSLPSFIDFNHPALKQPTQTLINEVKSKWEPSANNTSSTTPGTKEKSIKTEGQKNSSSLAQRRHLNLNDPAKNPVKPFLSRGSVAERVLLFEKCPELKSTRGNREHRRTKSPVLYNTWRGSHFSEDQNEEGRSPRELLRRKSRAGTSCKNSLSPGDIVIPKFHFPNGRPYTSLEVEEKIKKIKGEFEKLPAKCILSKLEMTRITKACDVPLFWKEPLRLAVIAARSNKTTASILNLNEVPNHDGNKITCNEFLDFWKKLLASSYEETTRFVKILTRGERNYLVHDDFISMIQDVVETHPGLLFLKDAIEFHSRYVHTVIARIFYCVNKSWSGKISIPELRKSNFLSVVAALEEEDDINQITDYFSYEHFYVIYCKFWELDKDHDLIIDKHDLSRHNDGTISVRMIDRIFSGAVTRGPVHKYGKMTYTEFVWFIISEEDKRHPRSIEYWFRCMDLDGDGFLSMFELEFFYSEQVRRMDAMGIEALPFNDALCQMIDMVSPENPDKISLADLKRCRMTPIFFDTFFNLDKYLDHEQKDPFASNKNEEEMSDWDKFAAEEYEILVAEENVNQPGKAKRASLE